MNREPRDKRMQKIRRKIRKVSYDLSSLHSFLESLPKPIRIQVQRELQRAFEASCDFSDLQSMPTAPPVRDNGVLKLGPELRSHILETRKIYADINDLRDIVSDIFDQKSGKILEDIIREGEQTVSGTEIIDISLDR